MTDPSARCPDCGQRLDASEDRDAYHGALLERLLSRGVYFVGGKDKAVLDACAGVERVWLEECAILDGPLAPPCRAELARRSSAS